MMGLIRDASWYLYDRHMNLMHHISRQLPGEHLTPEGVKYRSKSKDLLLSVAGGVITGIFWHSGILKDLAVNVLPIISVSNIIAPWATNRWMSKAPEVELLGDVQRESPLQLDELKSSIDYVLSNLDEIESANPEMPTMQTCADLDGEIFTGCLNAISNLLQRLYKNTTRPAQDVQLISSIPMIRGLQIQGGPTMVTRDASIAILAHELVHQQLIFSESRTQFLSIVALIESDDPILKHAGFIGWLEILHKECSIQNHPELLSPNDIRRYNLQENSAKNSGLLSQIGAFLHETQQTLTGAGGVDNAYYSKPAALLYKYMQQSNRSQA